MNNKCIFVFFVAHIFSELMIGFLFFLRSGVPGDYLLFQIGETAQMHSGGWLKATPHMVRGCVTPGTSRSTMAVFLEPGHDYDVAMPTSRYPIQSNYPACFVDTEARACCVI
jgi:isopenicillin N synthase-like dioxygenase